MDRGKYLVARTRPLPLPLPASTDYNAIIVPVYRRFFSASCLLAASALSCLAPSPSGLATNGHPPSPSASASSSTSTNPNNPASSAPKEPAEVVLSRLTTKFLDGYLAREPVAATEAGEHQFDGAFPDISVEGEAEARRFYQEILSALQRIHREELSLEGRVDSDILESQLRYALFALDELREPETSALHTMRLIRDGLEPLVSRHFGTPESRLRALIDRLSAIATLTSNAKKRLLRPSRIDTETAIAEAQSLVLFCRNELTKSFAKYQDEALVLRLARAGEDAARVLADFQTFLEKELLPRSDGSFRLGRARFEKKLRYYLDDNVDVDALEKDARRLLVETQNAMAETAKELWPLIFKGRKVAPSTTQDEKKALVREVLYALAWDSPSDQTLLPEAKDFVKNATAFVREHNLVTIPEGPIEVVEVPPSRRGISVGVCDSTGPLEDKPETVFAVSPAPLEWDDGRRLSYFREYNRSMLAELTIHEVMPGHFLQLVTNRKHTSKLRAVFASGPFVEGWAVYGEWLMAKHGFGGLKVRLQREKMLLRLAANAVLDCGVHAGKMSEADALVLLMGEAFQEESEAVGKWQRVELTSAQLSTYFYGFTEMMKLRTLAEKRPGFSERSFHDALLARGPVSMKHLSAAFAP